MGVEICSAKYERDIYMRSFRKRRYYIRSLNDSKLPRVIHDIIQNTHAANDEVPPWRPRFPLMRRVVPVNGLRLCLYQVTGRGLAYVVDISAESVHHMHNLPAHMPPLYDWDSSTL